MKKTALLILIIAFLFGGCQIKSGNISAPATENTTAAPSDTIPKEKKIRGIWVSCYDIESAEGKSREEYSVLTDKMFEKIAEYGFDTAFIHLRAYSDSFYQSDIFPYSKYIAGERGGELSFDPFAVMLESAEKYGISVHAWINPFRISYKNDTSELCENEPAARFIKEAGSAVGVFDSGIYYNPASTEAQKLILDGVKEILNKYPVDGIHIDDYFYPEDCEKIDEKEYNEYRQNGGKMNKPEWRRAVIDSFVSALYSCAKSISEELTVSISPSAITETNYNKLYADCKKWMSGSGYCDLMIPQIYFGFEGEKADFSSLFNEWNSYPRKCMIACGLAGYKCGTDKSEEWMNNPDVISKQIETADLNGWNGYVLFSYSDLIRTEALPSMECLRTEK